MIRRRENIDWIVSTRRQRARRGFTLMTVLWVMSMAGVATAAAVVVGRTGIGATRNRVAWERAYWLALGCARRTQSAIDAALTSSDIARRSASWRMLPTVVDGIGTVGCHVTLSAAGARLDLNSATEEMIARVLLAAGHANPSQLAEDIVAARDTQPFADVRDLFRVRGAELISDADSVFSVERGRVALSSASAIVLQAIPGFTAEIAQAIVARRDAADPIGDLRDVFALVSHESASELERRFHDALLVTTPEPDAWILQSAAISGLPATTAILEWRLARDGGRVAIVRASFR